MRLLLCKNKTDGRGIALGFSRRGVVNLKRQHRAGFDAQCRSRTEDLSIRSRSRRCDQRTAIPRIILPTVSYSCRRDQWPDLRKSSRLLADNLLTKRLLSG